MSFTFEERLENESAYEFRARQCPNCSSTELVKCAWPGCKVFACEEHLWMCEAHGDTKDTARDKERYCEKHLVWTDLICASSARQKEPVCVDCFCEIICDTAVAA